MTKLISEGEVSLALRQLQRQKGLFGGRSISDAWMSILGMAMQFIKCCSGHVLCRLTAVSSSDSRVCVMPISLYLSNPSNPMSLVHSRAGHLHRASKTSRASVSNTARKAYKYEIVQSCSCYSRSPGNPPNRTLFHTIDSSSSRSYERRLPYNLQITTSWHNNCNTTIVHPICI